MCNSDESAEDEQSRLLCSLESSKNDLKIPKPQHSSTGMSQFSKTFHKLFVTTNVSV